MTRIGFVAQIKCSNTAGAGCVDIAPARCRSLVCGVGEPEVTRPNVWVLCLALGEKIGIAVGILKPILPVILHVMKVRQSFVVTSASRCVPHGRHATVPLAIEGCLVTSFVSQHLRDASHVGGDGSHAGNRIFWVIIEWVKIQRVNVNGVAAALNRGSTWGTKLESVVPVQLDTVCH